MRGVDVQPYAALVAELSDVFEIIEGTGGSRSGGRDDGENLLSFLSELLECQSELGDVHSEILRADCDPPFAAETELTDRARHRVVGMLAIEDKRRIVADPILPCIGHRGI